MSQTKAQLIDNLVQALNFTGTASAPANGLFLSATNTLQLSTASTPRLTINSDGHVDVVGNLDVGAGLDVTGGIIASGNITANNGTITVSGTAPKITFTETNDNPDYKLEANGGNLAVVDTTNSVTRFSVSSSGASLTGGVLTLGTADTSSGHLNAFETMTFNIDTDNDDTNRYFAFYKNGASGSGTELFKIEESGQATVTGNLDVSSGLDATGGNITTTNGSVIANVGTNNQVVIGHDGAIEISRNSGGAFIDFKSDTSEDHDARIQENSGGFDISGNVNIASGLDVTGAITGTADMTIDTNTLHVDSSNNRVGIGVTNPASKLSVVDDSGIAIEATTDGANGKLTIIGKNTSGQVSAITRIESKPESGSNAATSTLFLNRDSGNAVNTHMTITSAGKVGIGTTGPGRQLSIVSSSDTIAEITTNTNANTAALYLHEGASGSTSNGGAILYNGSSNKLAISCGQTLTTERIIIDRDTGDVEITENLKTSNLSGRNMIINGDMRIAQRGTSGSYASSGAAQVLACDRWKLSTNGSEGTVAQVSEVPDGSGFKYSLKATVTNPTGSLSAGNYLAFIYAIERQDVQRLAYGTSSAKTSTISFWFRGSLAGKIGVKCSRNSKVFSTNTDVTANTWKFVEVVIPADTSTALSGTDYENGFDINITADAGSNYTSGATNNWIGTHVAYTAGFTNGQGGAYLTTDNSNFQITGVQFEIGSKATPFEHKHFSEEFLRCARYYQEQQGHSDLFIQAGKGQGSASVDAGCALVVPMRAQPSITLGGHRVFRNGNNQSSSTSAPTITNWDQGNSQHSAILAINLPGHSGLTNNEITNWCPHNALLQLDAEL